MQKILKFMVAALIATSLTLPAQAASTSGTTSVSVTIPTTIQLQDATTNLTSNSISYTATVNPTTFAVTGTGSVTWSLRTNNQAGAEIVAERTAFGGTGGSVFQNALTIQTATVSTTGGITPTYSNSFNTGSKTLASVPVGSTQTMVTTDKQGRLNFSMTVALSTDETAGDGNVTSTVTMTATTL